MDSKSSLDTKEIDVSINKCCWMLLSPITLCVLPYKTVLHLDAEEVTKTDTDLCGKHVSKRPYGELGSVDRSTCFCCISVTSSFGPISPGCGCDKDVVDDLVTLLKDRMRSRGETAQIRRAEETLLRLDEVDAKLNLIIDHFNIPKPDKMTDRLT